MIAFWDIVPFSLVEVDRRFRRAAVPSGRWIGRDQIMKQIINLADDSRSDIDNSEVEDDRKWREIESQLEEV
jgi:hypothetical protein